MQNVAGIDIDGVIRNFANKVYKTYIKKYPEHKNLITPQITWNMGDSYPIGKEIYKFIYEDNVEEIFSNAEPYPGAVDFINSVSNIMPVAFITAQNCGIEKYTLEWLKNNNNTYKHIFFTSNKKLINVTFLLDDKTGNLNDIKNTNIIPICYNQPWNQDYTGFRIFNYNEALIKIIEINNLVYLY